VRLRRGLYLDPDYREDSSVLCAVANRFYGPSYVSFAHAAGWAAGYRSDAVEAFLRSVQPGAVTSIFAGKLHAVLVRSWRSRVKGRDWFDMVYLIGQGFPVSLVHLEARLRQSGGYEDPSPLTKERLKFMLSARIDAVDLEAARVDAERFVRRPADLDVWSPESFRAMISRMEVLA